MFGIGRERDDDTFDRADVFEPAHLPDPGSFLGDVDVLVGDEHLAVHRLAAELFEERGVYDVTFGYNLARLNRDRRHPDAGFRYGTEVRRADGTADDGDESADDATVKGDDAAPTRVLRAEFTPTTEFCPQSEQLATGAFRAWNGLGERHEFDVVVVRVDGMHQESARINAALAELDPRSVDANAPSTASADGGRDGESSPAGGFESPF
ncbi:hypothetical protein [Halorubellus litoreus]|uniref:DUF7998 domain-containing protein n=1 Tax=Halorubellus litoreus TaxID=755308 RepID=A0ABD5VK75_9EURY